MVRSHVSILKLLIACTLVFVVVAVFVLPIQYARSYSELNTLSAACDLESVELTELASLDRACLLQLVNYLEDLIDNKDNNSNDDRSDRNIDQQAAEDAINEAIADFESAEAEVRNAFDEGENITDAAESLDYAADLIDDAIATYTDAEYAEAIDFAEEAERLIEDALDEIGSRDNSDLDRESDRDLNNDLDRDRNDSYGISRSEADDILTEAWFDLKNLRKEIDEVEYSYGYGRYIEEADELYEAARSILYEAEDAYIERRYLDAVDLVDEAQDIIDEAYDEL